MKFATDRARMVDLPQVARQLQIANNNGNKWQFSAQETNELLSTSAVQASGCLAD
jgi:hypothetical protein